MNTLVINKAGRFTHENTEIIDLLNEDPDVIMYYTEYYPTGNARQSFDVAVIIDNDDDRAAQYALESINLGKTLYAIIIIPDHQPEWCDVIEYRKTSHEGNQSIERSRFDFIRIKNGKAVYSLIKNFNTDKEKEFA